MKRPFAIILGAIVLLAAMLTLVGCVNGIFLHSHVYKPSFDEEGHFMKCECGEITDRVSHTLDWIIDKEPTYTEAGYKHQECSTCKYKTNENTAIQMLKEKDDYGTLKLEDELVSTLKDYLGRIMADHDMPSFTFGEKIQLIKEGYIPILVEFSQRCYYVAAYYTPSHSYEEYPQYCCRNEYTWVGFEKAENVKENWNGKKIVAAFQINASELCKNLKTGETDITMEHFILYNPDFSDGVALVPEIEFDNEFIYISYDGYPKYYSTDIPPHKPWSIDCIKLDGEYYATQYLNSQYNDGRYFEIDLKLYFGEYYDELMEIMIVNKYSKEYENETRSYALFKISDIEKIMSE